MTKNKLEKDYPMGAILHVGEKDELHKLYEVFGWDGEKGIVHGAEVGGNEKREIKPLEIHFVETAEHMDKMPDIPEPRKIETADQMRVRLIENENLVKGLQGKIQAYTKENPYLVSVDLVREVEEFSKHCVSGDNSDTDELISHFLSYIRMLLPRLATAMQKGWVVADAIEQAKPEDSETKGTISVSVPVSFENLSMVGFDKGSFGIKLIVKQANGIENTEAAKIPIPGTIEDVAQTKFPYDPDYKPEDNVIAFDDSRGPTSEGIVEFLNSERCRDVTARCEAIGFDIPSEILLPVSVGNITRLLDWLDYREAQENGEAPDKTVFKPDWIGEHEMKRVDSGDETEKLSPTEEAYEIGIAFAKAGKALTDNPYVKDDPLRELWIDGFSSHISG